MLLRPYLSLLLIGLCVTLVCSEKPRKWKKANSLDKKFLSLQKNLERLQLQEAALEAELEEELEEEIDSEAGSISDIIDFPSLTSSLENFRDDDDDEEEEEEEVEDQQDPCGDILCGPGKECFIDENGIGFCQCVEKCENIDDDRRKACSNHNETWPSDCELYRMRCLCEEDKEECQNQKFAHMHIDYYGHCQEVQECEEQEMADFPRRMREWLFNIMRDMADREALSDHYLKLEKMAEEDERKKWTNAAIWKWCELDANPQDRSISRHELFPLRAPLYTLEHCIAPFLDNCDANDDHRISLKEWTSCLELTEEHTEDMEDLCEVIRVA